jgi:excisionase family DNA binding protein
VERCTIPEAAALLGISPRSVRELIESGRLDGTRLGGRWFVSLGSVRRAREDSGGDGVLSQVLEVNELSRRVNVLEARLEELEAAHEDHSPAGAMRPALAPLFRTGPATES